MGQLVWQGSCGQGLWAGVWGRLTTACSGLVSAGSLVPPTCGLKNGGARLSHVAGWFPRAVWCSLHVGLRTGRQTIECNGLVSEGSLVPLLSERGHETIACSGLAFEGNLVLSSCGCKMGGTGRAHVAGWLSSGMC